MSLLVRATGASQIAPGIWSFEMPPHQVRMFGNTNNSIGLQSVILLTEHKYDPKVEQLDFAFDQAIPINIGTTSRVIGLAAGMPDRDPRSSSQTTEIPPPSLGRGDREFIELAKTELSECTAKAAENLLLAVRSRSAGDLKRGQSRNFSETPDNFWYVIVQPRVDELSITVRGSTDHFSPIAKLEIRDDRGNTRFKVRRDEDIPAAIELIFHAIRKR